MIIAIKFGFFGKMINVKAVTNKSQSRTKESPRVILAEIKEISFSSRDKVPLTVLLLEKVCM